MNCTKFYLLLLVLLVFSCQEKKQEETNTIQKSGEFEDNEECHFDLEGKSEEVLPFGKDIYFSNLGFSPFSNNKIWFIDDYITYEYDLQNKKYYPLDSLYNQDISIQTLPSILKDKYSNFTWFVGDQNFIIRMNRIDNSFLKLPIKCYVAIYGNKDKLILFNYESIVSLNRNSLKVDTLFSINTLENEGVSDILNTRLVNENQILLDKSNKIYNIKKNRIEVDSTFLKHYFYMKIGKSTLLGGYWDSLYRFYVKKCG